MIPWRLRRRPAGRPRSAGAGEGAEAGADGGGVGGVEAGCGWGEGPGWVRWGAGEGAAVGGVKTRVPSGWRSMVQPWSWARWWWAEQSSVRVVEPAGRPAVPSEEPAGHMRGWGSSESSVLAQMIPPVPQRSCSPASGPPAPQRGQGVQQRSSLATSSTGSRRAPSRRTCWSVTNRSAVRAVTTEASTSALATGSDPSPRGGDHRGGGHHPGGSQDGAGLGRDRGPDRPTSTAPSRPGRLAAKPFPPAEAIQSSDSESHLHHNRPPAKWRGGSGMITNEAPGPRVLGRRSASRAHRSIAPWHQAETMWWPASTGVAARMVWSTTQ